MLHGQRRAARLLEDAQPGPLTYPGRQRHVEDLHEDPSHVAPHPLVEDRDKKIAVLPRRDRAVRHRVPFLEARLVVPFHDGDELDELRAGLIAQEAIDLQRMGGIGRVDGGEDVKLNPVLLQEVQALHHPIEGGAATLVNPVAVVYLTRAIDADADEEIVGAEEAAPIVVQRCAVGL